MARVLTLGQRCPHGGKMLIRGTFSQKLKLWKVLGELVDVESMTIFDDVTGREVAATYGALCDRLRVNGRVTIQASDGVREFQVVEGEMNSLRGWDVGEEGPVCNPVGK